MTELFCVLFVHQGYYCYLFGIGIAYLIFSYMFLVSAVPVHQEVASSFRKWKRFKRHHPETREVFDNLKATYDPVEATFTSAAKNSSFYLRMVGLVGAEFLFVEQFSCPVLYIRACLGCCVFWIGLDDLLRIRIRAVFRVSTRITLPQLKRLHRAGFPLHIHTGTTVFPFYQCSGKFFVDICIQYEHWSKADTTRPTERQTDIQPGRQAGREVDRHAVRQAGRQTN